VPSTVNGTELSRQEFRDALLLRYGRTPGDLQSHCDGCGQKFSVRHGLECKKGGNVISRHNEIRDELSDLASKALIPSAVRDEPRIYPSRPQCRCHNWIRLIPQLSATYTRIEVDSEKTYCSEVYGQPEVIVSSTSVSQTQKPRAISLETPLRSGSTRKGEKEEIPQALPALSNVVISPRSWSPLISSLARKMKLSTLLAVKRRKS
jgi:hypothetical protein